jgi:hypothetical protein
VKFKLIIVINAIILNFRDFLCGTKSQFVRWKALVTCEMDDIDECLAFSAVEQVGLGPSVHILNGDLK